MIKNTTTLLIVNVVNVIVSLITGITVMEVRNLEKSMGINQDCRTSAKASLLSQRWNVNHVRLNKLKNKILNSRHIEDYNQTQNLICKTAVLNRNFSCISNCDNKHNRSIN